MKTLGWLFLNLGDYTTPQLEGDYNNPLKKIPINQLVFHGMSQGFDPCSHGLKFPLVVQGFYGASTINQNPVSEQKPEFHRM